MWLGAYQEFDGDFPAGGGAPSCAAAVTAAPRGLRGRRVLSATTSSAAAAAASARCAVSAQLPPLFRLTAQTFSAQSASRFISQVATFHFNRFRCHLAHVRRCTDADRFGHVHCSAKFGVGRPGGGGADLHLEIGSRNKNKKQNRSHTSRARIRTAALKAASRLGSAGGWRLRRKEAAAAEGGSRLVLGPRVREKNDLMIGSKKKVSCTGGLGNRTAKENSLVSCMLTQSIEAMSGGLTPRPRADRSELLHPIRLDYTRHLDAKHALYPLQVKDEMALVKRTRDTFKGFLVRTELDPLHQLDHTCCTRPNLVNNLFCRMTIRARASPHLGARVGWRASALAWQWRAEAGRCVRESRRKLARTP